MACGFDQCPELMDRLFDGPISYTMDFAPLSSMICGKWDHYKSKRTDEWIFLRSDGGELMSGDIGFVRRMKDGKGERKFGTQGRWVFHKQVRTFELINFACETGCREHHLFLRYSDNVAFVSVDGKGTKRTMTLVFAPEPFMPFLPPYPGVNGIATLPLAAGRVDQAAHLALLDAPAGDGQDDQAAHDNPAGQDAPSDFSIVSDDSSTKEWSLVDEV